MSKRYLIRRLSWYYPTERFNAFLFGAVVVGVLCYFPIRQVLFLAYGLVVMTVILFQGQKYWQIKLYQLTDKPFNQTVSLNFFRKAKTVNQWLIGVMPAVFGLQCYWLEWTLGSTGILIFSLAANGFAVLEHINYYHRQLSIDNMADVRYLRRHKRFKVAQLAKDLENNKI